MRQRLGGLDEVPAKAIVDPIREGLPHRVGLEVADEPGPLERPPEDPPGLHAGPIAWWNQMDGFEYSVVSQDDFGQRFMIKLNVIPVIPSLIKNPIFGGN
jgi:hypothetical protein